MTVTDNKLDVVIRWIIRRDMPEVLEIENSSFDIPWSESDFMHCLRQRRCIGMVAESYEKIVGFIVYDLQHTRIHVFNLAVHPDFRRSQIGTQMIKKLVSKLSHQRRTQILLEVRETNLAAQVFFRAMGFRAISVLREFYDDTVEDGYLMEYRLSGRSDWKAINRISSVIG